MEEMQALAAEMKFEEAQKIKEKYDLIENYRSKSEVVNSIIHNVDVFSIEMEENSAYINYLHIQFKRYDDFAGSALISFTHLNNAQL